MAQSIAFYIISGLLLFSALMVVTQRSVFTCALYLAGALSMVAGFFVLLDADFLAAVQILLYVGGILVILAFAVLLTNIQQSISQPQKNEQWLPALVLCLGIFLIVLMGLKKTPFASNPGTFQPTTAPIGSLLLNDMALPFELISLILLASLAGAVYFSKREDND